MCKLSWGCPRKNTTADTTGSATTAAAAPTIPQPPQTHVMTTRAQAFHTSARDALAPLLFDVYSNVDLHVDLYVDLYVDLNVELNFCHALN
jgi:hypothetical protein